MVDTVIGPDTLSRETLYELVEAKFEESARLSALCSLDSPEKEDLVDDHIQGILHRELIFYEYKELIIMLCQKLNKKNSEMKLFIEEWIEKLSQKQISIRFPSLRNWKSSEKEAQYLQRLENKKIKQQEELARKKEEEELALKKQQEEEARAREEEEKARIAAEEEKLKNSKMDPENSEDEDSQEDEESDSYQLT